MPNILPFEKQVLGISMLAEGTSIRAVERVTGIHRDTIMRLGVRVGEACGKLMDEKMRGLPCKRLEMDEIWGFVGTKQRKVKADDENANERGDMWTFVAIDPETKAIPAYYVGKRDYAATNAFITDVSARMSDRISLSSDGMVHYTEAVESEFGGEVDYGQIIKVYSGSTEGVEGKRRYSPPYVQSVKRVGVIGQPDIPKICTSHVEAQNLTMRMHIRRLTRLTNAWSKKLENFRAAIALHFAYANFVKIHTSTRVTPAMALGVSSRLWKVSDLVELAA